MKRPHLVNFLAIMTEESLAIRASMTMKDNPLLNLTLQEHKELAVLAPKFPIQAYKLLTAHRFTILVIGLSKEHTETFRKTFESDAFGHISFKIPLIGTKKETEVLQIYEIGHSSGLQLILGNYLPLKVYSPKKIVICDFDKTLVDTRYSSTREVYDSLTKAISEFPTIPKSLEMLHESINKGYHPFILSASPHFYEEAMRDWLYQNKVYSSGIFLKDYRHILSLFEGELSPKDIKLQGLYKLGHLLDILLMTGLPDEIVLMGDNFESDPIIYLALAKMLREDLEPWYIWKLLKAQKAFRPSRRQNSQFLNKIYQLTNLVAQHDKKNKSRPVIKVFIRKKASENDINVPDEFSTQRHLIQLYDGPSQKKEAEVSA